MLNFNSVVAKIYAELYVFFLKPRKEINSNVYDWLIAAAAIIHDFVVLISPINDFKKIPKLIVEYSTERSQ